MILNKQKNIAIAKRIAGNLLNDEKVYASYTTDLGLIGLLYLYDATGESEYLEHVAKVWEFRRSKDAAHHNWKILFVCLHFETYMRTSDKAYIEDFVDVVKDMNSTLPYNKEGAVCHLQQTEKKMIFVDLLQAYAIYNTRAGFLCNDESFFHRAAKQYELYRNELRDTKTGLWHQGKNWHEADKVSPGFWNRGQGWTLAGIVESMHYMPAKHEAQEKLKKILDEFASDLLQYQDERGMWHQLVDEPGSYPETSGTAMFAHYLTKAVKNGWLDAGAFQPAIDKAVKALQGYVTKTGKVLNTSYGTGPLKTLEGYRYRPAPLNEPHGPGTMLMGLTAPNIEYGSM